MYKVNQDDVFENAYGTFKVINYVNSRNVLIEWQDSYKHQVWTTASNIYNGHNKNPYFPLVFGIGFIGVGEFFLHRKWQNYN